MPERTGPRQALLQGYLLKRNRGGNLKGWDRRFFTLDSAAVLTYHSVKAHPEQHAVLNRLRQVHSPDLCELFLCLSLLHAQRVLAPGHRPRCSCCRRR